jgi:hypothetical protein
MSIFERHGRALVTFLIAAVLMLALRLAAIPFADARSDRVDREITEKKKEFVEFYNEDLPATAAMVAADRQASIKDYQEKIALDKDKVRLGWDGGSVKVPQDKRNDPGRYWVTQYINCTDKLIADAEEASRRRPENRPLILTAGAENRPLILTAVDANGTLNRSATFGLKADYVVGAMTVDGVEVELRKLWVMDKIIRLAMEQKVTCIVKVDPKNEYVDGVHEKRKKTDGKVGDDLTYRFIKLNPVQIELVADFDAVMNFLKSVQSEKQRLAITRFTVMARPVITAKNVDAEVQKRAQEWLRADHELYVIVEAAGMDFFGDQEEEKINGNAAAVEAGNGVRTLEDIQKEGGGAIRPLGH